MNNPSVDFDRRTILALAATAALPLPLDARGAAATATTLWYERPADQWVEALPVGNGRLGAMVFGRVGQERLQFNEDTLWAGSPYDPVNPAARAALPQIRALIDRLEFARAADLAQATMMAHPLKQMPYGTLGDLLLTHRDPEAPHVYRRELNLADAIASTVYRTASGTFIQEVFASSVDQAIIVRLTARGKRASLNFDIDHRGPQQARYGSWDATGPATRPNAAAIDWARKEAAAPSSRPEGLRVLRDGPAAVLITGRNESAQNIPAGLRYAMRVEVVCDGDADVSNETICVRNAKNAILIVAAATDHIDFRTIGGDPASVVREQCRKAAAQSYTQLKRDHIAAHRALFDRVKLDLGAEPPAPTDARILAASTAADPSLAALYFHYARYLLISSSRTGTQPANLQGLWNEGTNPPWDSKYTININTEMNYWPADPAALGECVEPLIRLVEDLSVTGAGTAAAMYGARGWVAHHNTDLWRATAPVDGAFWGLWPTGGAWLCTTLWNHYRYHPEPTLLNRLRPLLRGASRFFLDTMVADPSGRGLVTSPSISPENAHMPNVSICAGPAMDRQILRDLFDATLAAETLTHGSSDFIAELKEKRALIAPDRIGAHGQLQEWLDDWDAAAPEQQHRHVSHLYGVYPSSQINVRDTPELTEAARVSLRARGDLATGWGTAWRACLWARLGDGDHAHRILKGLISAERTYPDLLDACPPFQIDGNFGGAAAIAEMLLQSWGGEIKLLPALPAAWPRGAVSGLCAEGGVRVDMSWAGGALQRVALQGAPRARIELRYRDRSVAVTLAADGKYVSTTI